MLAGSKNLFKRKLETIPKLNPFWFWDSKIYKLSKSEIFATGFILKSMVLIPIVNPKWIFLLSYLGKFFNLGCFCAKDCKGIFATNKRGNRIVTNFFISAKKRFIIYFIAMYKETIPSVSGRCWALVKPTAFRISINFSFSGKVSTDSGK